MATLPLDLRDLLAEAGSGAVPEQAASGTRIGHVHLQVSELGAAERFYADGLGFDVVVGGYPGALFVSAGGYHHHVGLNTWNSRGAGAPPPEMAGLRGFEIRLPDEQSLMAAAERVGGGTEAGVSEVARNEAAGVTQGPRAAPCITVRDPSGNNVILTC